MKHNSAQLHSRRGIYSTDAFDYYKWIMRIANQLGKQRVKILLYEDLVFQPEKFFNQLADIFHDKSVADLIRLKETRFNVSPTSSMVLPRLPKAIRWARPMAKPLLDWAKKVSVREIYLHKDFKANLLGLYTYSNSLLADEFSLALEEYGYF